MIELSNYQFKAEKVELKMINFVSSFEKCIVHEDGLHSGMTDQHLLPGDFISIIKNNKIER